MATEKKCGVGDIKIGKADLNQLWSNVDRYVYPREKIYAVAEKVGCTQCCPCRKYGELSKMQLFPDRIDELISFRDRENKCDFYRLDLGDYEPHQSWCMVTQQCRLVELMEILDLAYKEGSKITLKREGTSVRR